MVFNILLTIMNTIDKAGGTNNQHIGTKEADKGGDFEGTSIQNGGTDDTATNASKDTDETIGGVHGRKEAVEDINQTRDNGVDRNNNDTVSQVVLSKEK